MIDVMTRLKVHNMAEGGVKHATIAEKCNISLRSVERILEKETAPTVNEVVANARADAKRIQSPTQAGRRPITE